MPIGWRGEIWVCNAPRTVGHWWREDTLRLEQLSWMVGLEGGWHGTVAPTHQGVGRSSAGLPSRRQRPRRRLNDVVCVCVGKVRAPDDPKHESSDLGSVTFGNSELALNETTMIATDAAV